MRRPIPLETYSRRTTRLHARRDEARRRQTVLAGVAAAVLMVGIVVASLMWPSAHRTTATSSTKTTAPKDTGSVTATASPASAKRPARPTTSGTAAQTSDPSRPPTITIAAVGDMLFDRRVRQLVQDEGGEAPLSDVAARLSMADVTVGNLETALSDRGTRTTVKEAKYCFRGSPASIKGLELAGFDALSLANNHMMDYGFSALSDTLTSLDSAGIGHAGAGADTSAAWKAASIETSGGAKVAFLAFSHVVPLGFWSGDQRAGIATAKNDLDGVDRAIREAKESHDYVIVSFHWGQEYDDGVNGNEVSWAHRAIDAGADMIVGHHPHVIQATEFYKNRLIAYSLGDFVFDHYSRKTGESFILQAQLGPNGTPEARAVPVYLNQDGRPEYVSGSESRQILDRLKLISQGRSHVVLRGDIARIAP